MRSFWSTVEKNTCVNPLGFAFRTGRNKTAMDRLRGFVFRNLLRGCTVKSGFLRVFTLVFRPFVIFALSIRCFANYSRLISYAYNIGKIRFFSRMLRVCLFRNVTPIHYCRNQFFLGDIRDVDEYLFGNEAAVLLPQLNDDPSADTVDDKEKFYNICLGKNLPVPAIFGVVGPDGGQIELPHEDIVVKPARGSKGAGVEIWEYRSGSFAGPKGVLMTPDELLNDFRSRAETNGNRQILQRRIRCHTSLSNLSKNVLITARIVTYRDSDGVFRVMSESMILSLGEESGRIRQAVSPILGTPGRLGAAVPYGIIRKDLPAHPVTSAPILDVPVPFREETLSLALRAHAVFPDFFSLGWDIAITDDGPIILETNKAWDAETVQRPDLHPIGQRDFADAAVAVIRNKAGRNRKTVE